MPDTAERVRLIFCHQCHTVQEVPGFTGPQEYDDTLNARLAEHTFGDGRAHHISVGDIEKAQWAKPDIQRKVIDTMAGENGEGSTDGLGAAFYEVKANYEMDAVLCWKTKHNRTVDCADYMTSKMKLLPDTRAERRDLGLSSTSSKRPGTYLCQFCPVHSIKQTRQRAAKGLYEDPYK